MNLIFFIFLFSTVTGYGTPPPPPPPCNTPQCQSGTFCYSSTNQCTDCPPGYRYNSNPNVGVSNVALWGCTICSPGTFSSSSSPGCSLCSPGTFQNNAGQTTCKLCPSNTFSNINGASSCATCTVCPPGTWTMSQCTSSSNTQCSTCSHINNCGVETCTSSSNTLCSFCLSGYYLSNTCNQCTICNSAQYETKACSTLSNRECSQCTNSCQNGYMLSGICSGTLNPDCIICPTGYYKTTFDSSPCLQCTTSCNPGFELNQICSPTVNSICTPCQTGFYKTTSDRCISCTNSCNVGFELNQPCSSTINPICIPCHSGYYKSIVGNSPCLLCTSSCGSGMELNQLCGPTVNPICIPCQSGFYKSLSDGSKCLPCTNICNPGFELNQACTPTINPMCIQCQNGFYSSNGLNCLPCTSDCGPGSYLNSICSPTNNPGCIFCPANTANPNHFSLFESSCVSCANGAIAAIGSATCLQCPLGTATFGNNNCSNCNIGTYSDNLGSITCKLCPGGTANNNINSSTINDCIPCLTGYYASIGSSHCISCPIGTFGINNANKISDCLSCPFGTYNNNTGQSICTPCPNGTANYKTNSDNINDCIQCSPGTFSTEGAPSCLQCPAGKSSYKTGASDCFINLPGTFTSTDGSITPSNCYPGYYNDNYGAVVCKACSAGFYNYNSGSTNINNCSECQIGSYSLNGSDLCSICTVGTYQDKIAQSSCNLCPQGTFNNNTNSTKLSDCTLCSPGTFQSHQGSSNCSICPSGFYQDIYYQSSCKSCPAGTFNMLNGTTNFNSCIPCPVGTYSTIVAANTNLVCISSPIGTFVNTSGSANYTECYPGYYQDSMKEAMCIPCPAGTFNPNYRSSDLSVCKECSPGFYSLSAYATCISCNPGFYSNVSGSKICTPCMPGYYTDIYESINCMKCPKGSIAIGYGLDKCNPIGNVTSTVTTTSNSAIVSIYTNFTFTLPLVYMCSDYCELYLNNNLVNIGSGLIYIDVTIDDIIMIVFNGTLNNTWNCSMPSLDYVSTQVSTHMSICYSAIPNVITNVITHAILVTERNQDNVYADPDIVFTSYINISSLSNYTFQLDNLEASVYYSSYLILQLKYSDEFYLPLINLENNIQFKTLPAIPTGPVQNLVKFFLGIDLIEQENNEQSNLQINWDLPLVKLQHGLIIGYTVNYIQEERKHITYGPNVNLIIRPAKQFTLVTNQTTLILTNLLPDTNYTITVHPMTHAIGLGPGTTIQLRTRVSAPLKPPMLTLLKRETSTVLVSWPSFTNETGVITKAWILSEPYLELVSSEVVHIPINSTLPELPFPHTGIKGFFGPYNVSNTCDSHIFGFTFHSLTTDNICGGLCDTICEYGTQMLDPTTILPTNNPVLFNDFYLMEFNNSNGTFKRFVPYLTMKKRFVLEQSDGGLNLSGKILIGDGFINKNSLLNNTVLDDSLSYRLRLIVFTSETLYSISDPLEIGPFEQSSISLTKAVWIGLVVAISLILLCLFFGSCIKRRLKKYNLKKIEISENEDIVNKSKYLDVSQKTEPTYFDPTHKEPIKLETKYLDVSTSSDEYDKVKSDINEPKYLNINEIYLPEVDEAPPLPLKNKDRET